MAGSGVVTGGGESVEIGFREVDAGLRSEQVVNAG